LKTLRRFLQNDLSSSKGRKTRKEGEHFVDFSLVQSNRLASIIKFISSLLLLSLRAPPNFAGLPGCEGGDEGRRG